MERLSPESLGVSAVRTPPDAAADVSAIEPRSQQCRVAVMDPVGAGDSVVADQAPCRH